ncbi:MAG TPA: hypothetical protein DCX23_03290 [Lachnospiraceae bacterium]|nr:hypothetical protein [Lachnospiraceae bacterium]
MFNRIVKIATVSGLAAITALTSLGMGSVNVLADDAKLPAYVINGTNAERAISDYFVNTYAPIKDDSVVIPHMDIISTKDNGSSFDVYGGFCIQEYTKDDASLIEDGMFAKSIGHFVLNKNADDTYTIASYQDIPDNASKEDFNQIFGAGLSDEAFNVYSENFYSDLWNSIRTQDVAYYSYDNNLGLSKIGVDESHSIDLANVSFSNSGAHTMYAQQDANVRSAATTLSTAFDGIGKGQDITVTGLANGWYRVGMNGRTGFISASLLDDSKPVKEKAEEKKAEKKEEKKESDESKYSSMTGVIENFTGSDITVGGVTVNVTGSTAISGDLKDGDVATIYFYSGEHGINYATSILSHGTPSDGAVFSPDGRVIDTETMEEVGFEMQGDDEWQGGLSDDEKALENGDNVDDGEEYVEVELED